MKYCRPFRHIRLTDIASVGGKNASTGEMLHALASQGIRIPDGFALTAHAYRVFLESNHLSDVLQNELNLLDVKGLSNLQEVGRKCRWHMAHGTLSNDIWQETCILFDELCSGIDASVAVRSSATAEDLPTASFAGQHSSFLHVRGYEALRKAIVDCYVSLFNDRAIKYRIDNGFSHMSVALSVGVQRMVRSDLGTSGVAFTIDPETGFDKVIYITSSWGLGENIVQGAVNPDEFYVYKRSLLRRDDNNGLIQFPVIRKRMGSKENEMIFSDDPLNPIVNVATPQSKRDIYSLSDEEVQIISQWCMSIEEHYKTPMDIEFAKDGITGELFIVQARPETVEGRKEHLVVKEYKLKTKSEPLCTGKAVGYAIACGTVRIIKSLADAGRVKNGDVIVADITNPDWNALLRKAVCIVTNKGGRTSHASIVARELGIHAVVGTSNATEKLHDGQIITVSCVEGDIGRVYDNVVKWDESDVKFEDVAKTNVKPMFILADPDKAFRLSFYPSEGVGLMRMEFIITNSIKIHPMALVKFDELPECNDKKSIEAITRHYADKKEFFVDQLSQSIAVVAAAFYPRTVILRMSDFKTNEYEQLIGGTFFEPKEENPMLGFRGASRYYNERYRDGFGLECAAVLRVRNEMGFDNVKVMIPFCRTTDEGKRVLETMKEYGLERGSNGLEVYVMAEIPSNVILAKEFAEIFDGFSIGSNDLTQLTLGIDRDSSIISDLFDESNAAVKSMLRSVIASAHAAGRPIGLCGQAPSDHPEFAQFLVEQEIDSISFTPDALLRGIQNISLAESNMEPGTQNKGTPSWKNNLTEKSQSLPGGALASGGQHPLLLLNAEHE